MTSADWQEQILFRMLRVARMLRIDRILLFRGSAHPFLEYFIGFENEEAVKTLFGNKTDEVLQKLQVQFMWAGGYMGVNAANGHLMVNTKYLNKGDKVDIYLDVIHELVHVKQFMEGRELFDPRYTYVERPTEVEAYNYAVAEARKLGLTDERICQYLRTEWMSDTAFRLLVKTLGVKCSNQV